MAELVSGGTLSSSSSHGEPDREGILGRARTDGARLGMDYTPPVRAGAFNAADRHSARVRFLKRSIVLGSLVGVTGIALIVLCNPFRHLPGGISLASVGVSGTKITMELPKISGIQQGGGPYEVRAKTGIQDITTPSIMELLGVDALIGMADATTTHVTSNHGTYDSRADMMNLAGNVTIANTSGYTLNLQTALMDFRAGMLTSHERLRVDIKGGEVSSDDIVIANNGHVINFRGNVASRFESGSLDDEPTRQVEADVR